MVWNDADGPNPPMQVVPAGLERCEFTPGQGVAAQRGTMLAWERFVTGQSLVTTPVDRAVLVSWQRSRQSGVSPAGRMAPMAAHGDSLERLRLRHQGLIQASKGLFDATASALASSRSIIILTNLDGIVLDAAGNMQTLETGREVNLMQGGHWSESMAGTNGIGMALTTGLPSLVHAAEHFCEGIKRWTCAAAPIRRPGTGQILGVIDISGPPSTYQLNNLALAISAARQIETVLAVQAMREQLLLFQVCLQRQAATAAVGILAIDCGGCILHLSGVLPNPLLQVGQRLTAFDPSRGVAEWTQNLPEGLRPEWFEPVRSQGVVIGALVVVPPQARTARLTEAATASEADPQRSGFADLLGHSPAMTTAIERARHLAGKRVPVLIQGETGVGKELFARAIHGDDRLSGPFVAFNCGAATKELMAGELFGHVRGAFTGATTEGRAGRFELAHGGTLCLDEIGELPLELQPVLLRALEEGVIYRLGDSKPRRVDVRLLAMTNRDLLHDIEAGRFRRDLYHRICVTRVRIPPLRERVTDIDLLVERFNQRLAERHGVAQRYFGAEVMAALRAYSWPGNVRELRNVVESLLLLSDDKTVLRAELPDEILAEVGAADPADDARQASLPLSAATSLEAAERQTIGRALVEFHGNLAKAARSLGISRSTLYRKVEHHHLKDSSRSVAEADLAA